MDCKYRFHEYESIGNREMPLLYDLLGQYRNRFFSYTDDESQWILSIQESIEANYRKETGCSLRDAPGNLRRAGRKSSLSEEQVDEILRMYREGKTQKEIASTMGFSRSYIQQILSIRRFGTRSYEEHLASLQ